jgi:hypothetical protein
MLSPSAVNSPAYDARTLIIALATLFALTFAGSPNHDVPNANGNAGLMGHSSANNHTNITDII